MKGVRLLETGHPVEAGETQSSPKTPPQRKPGGASGEDWVGNTGTPAEQMTQELTLGGTDGQGGGSDAWRAQLGRPHSLDPECRRVTIKVVMGGIWGDWGAHGLAANERVMQGQPPAQTGPAAEESPVLKGHSGPPALQKRPL